MRWRTLLPAIFLFTWGLKIWASPGEAAGPWRGQIVDAETRQPLEGVVVLAVWIRYTASLGGWAGGEYYGSEEIVTGPDGRFEIPGRWTFTLNPFKTIRGPEFTIFKPGYGDWWRFIDAEASKKFDKGEEIIFKLPPLKTREERLKFLPTRPTHVVPPERMKHLAEALEGERAFLGLGR